jgi:hypothetical protein
VIAREVVIHQIASLDSQITKSPITYRQVTRSPDREMILPARLATTAAAPTAAETATTAAAAATTAAFTETTGARLAWACLVHGQRTSAEILAVQLIDGALGPLRRAHLDKSKAPRASRHLVTHHADRLDGIDLPKEILQRLFVGIVGQIADIQLPVSHGHSSSRAARPLALELGRN